MARRITPTAEQHGEIGAVDLGVEVGIASCGIAWRWGVNGKPPAKANFVRAANSSCRLCRLITAVSRRMTLPLAAADR